MDTFFVRLFWDEDRGGGFPQKGGFLSAPRSMVLGGFHKWGPFAKDRVQPAAYTCASSVNRGRLYGLRFLGQEGAIILQKTQ
jgi:hypothetical protein